MISAQQTHAGSPFLFARLGRLIVVFSLTLLVFAGGCAVLRLGENFPRALANHPDPDTVAASLPGYMLLVDSLILDDGANAGLLVAGAKLHVLYAGAFVDDPERVRLLSDRALGYASRAVEEDTPEAANLAAMPLDRFRQLLAVFDRDDLPLLSAYGMSWLLWIKTHADDMGALAQLPRAEEFFDRMAALDETYDGGSVHVYLGMLRTLRPPALGGDPERGRRHFERATELSDGQNLAAKVELARSYARMVYDRELHDRLLGEVLAAPTEAEGFTLTNALAKRDAKKLLATADGHF